MVNRETIMTKKVLPRFVKHLTQEDFKSINIEDRRKEIILEGFKNNKTLNEIGSDLGGISKQRVYQLLTHYHILIPENRRDGFWKKQSNKDQWLHRIILNKKLSKLDRHNLFEHLKQQLPDYCPILDIKLEYNINSERKNNSASLDRIDSSKGYVIGNIRIISWRANRIKNDGTLDEHKRVVEYMLKNKLDF